MSTPYQDQVPFISAELAEYLERVAPQSERPDFEKSQLEIGLREGELRFAGMLLAARQRQLLGGRELHEDEPLGNASETVEIGM